MLGQNLASPSEDPRSALAPVGRLPLLLPLLIPLLLRL